MSDLKALRGSLHAVDRSILHHLKDRITRPYKSCENLGWRMWGIHGHYRSRGILRYLLDADTDAFFSDLSREALTYVTFLKAYREGLDISESLVNGSTFLPLICALTTANFGLCAELDQLMPREFGEYDGEAPFAFTTMLRRLTVEEKGQDVKAAVRKLAEADAGAGQYHSIIPIVEGLVEGEEKAFNSGLATYLALLEDVSEEEAAERDPGDEFVSVEALGLIQLAKRKGIRIRVGHRMIPPELQDAKAVSPSDGYPSWPG